MGNEHTGRKTAYMDHPEHDQRQIDLAPLAVSIFAAAIIVSLGQWGVGSPRYQITATQGGVVRVDTINGSLLACDLNRCKQINAGPVETGHRHAH